MNNKKTILIVEDEVHLRLGLMKFFTDKNFTVFSADSYKSALALDKLNTVDVAILDIGLGEHLYSTENGVELAKELRKLNFPIIFLSGYHEDDIIMKQVIAAGFSHFITKPIVNEQLWAAVQLLLAVPSKKEIIIKNGNATYKIHEEDIFYVTTKNEITTIYTTGSNPIRTDLSLTQFLSKKAPFLVRISKDTAINRNKVHFVRHEGEKIVLHPPHEKKDITYTRHFKKNIAHLLPPC